MAIMWLLNPPKKKFRRFGRKLRRHRNPRMASIGYPKHMGKPAKKHARPSKTYGGNRIFKSIAQELGLREGQRPLKHRITVYRHPSRKKKKYIRSPFAVARNPKHKKNKGGEILMARRKRRHSKRSQRRNPKHVRRHRRARRNAPKHVSRKRRSHRRSRSLRAVALYNPGRRHVSRRRHRRNPAGRALAVVGGLKAPVIKAASLFGGYFAARVGGNYLEKYVGGYIAPYTGRWTKPVCTAASALALSYFSKKYIFKNKPEIANFILIGGLFSVVKDVVANLKGYIPAGTVPAEVDNALGEVDGYVSEPIAGYVEEPMASLNGLEQEDSEIYKPLY